MIAFLILQAAAAQPDIQLGVRVRADSLRIERKGEAELTVSSSPEGGNRVDVQAPEADGKRQLRNIDVRVDAEARIGDPKAEQQETPSSSPR